MESPVVRGAEPGAAGGNEGMKAPGDAVPAGSAPPAGLPAKGYVFAGWGDGGMETPGKNELRKQMSSVGPVV